MKYFLIVYIKNLANLFVWFFLIPTCLSVIISPVILIAMNTIVSNNGEVAGLSINNETEFATTSQTGSDSYSVPKNDSIHMLVGNQDYRVDILDEFFRRYGSPLEGYGYSFVEACDKYDAPYDCTTLPAIAYVETGLCTLANSYQERNCWGFGGSPPNRFLFDSFQDAIDLITDRLVNAYGPRYMTNPVSMQHTYCGPQCNRWGVGVQQKRYEINRLSEEMGFPPLIRE